MLENLTVTFDNIVFRVAKSVHTAGTSNSNIMSHDKDLSENIYILDGSNTASENILPDKSSNRYNNSYNKFMDWRLKNEMNSFSEKVMLFYFEELSHKLAPSTLWALYSMLKSTISIKHNINIKAYPKLMSFLRRQSDGYKSKKSKILTPAQINDFIGRAPDHKYLLMKVILVIGVCGACSKQELKDMKRKDVEDMGHKLIINITKSSRRSFVVSDGFYAICKKYMNLLPEGNSSLPLFMRYQNGKCVRQVIGVNNIGSIPSVIAKYVGCADFKQYSGHCFRRSSAKIVGAGGDLFTHKRDGWWRPYNVAEGQCRDQAVLPVQTMVAVNTRHEKFILPKPDGYVEIKAIADQPMNDTLSQLQSAEGPSTSSLPQPKIEIKSEISSVKIEDHTTENVYQDDADFDDGDGEVLDTKVDLLDIEDTQILLNEVDPLRVEVNSQYPTPKECDLFGEYIAKHLQQLPLDAAFKLQSGIQALVMQTRLEYVRQHPSEAPPMVKQEAPAEEDEPTVVPKSETQTNPPSDNPVQNRAEKRPRDTEPTQAKRFKSDDPGTKKQNSNSSTTKHKRTECTVFAEHIALQLEQLPEEVSLKLQSEIFELITHSLPRPAAEDAPNRVKIKDEPVEINPTQMIDYHS